MMYLGDKAVGINQKDFLAQGSYIPNEDVSTITIDTHNNSWKHFLLKVKTLPYTEQPSRGFGLMYVDIIGQYEMYIFNSSSGQSYPGNAVTYAIGSYTTINDGVITKTGIASQTGKLIANTEYEWYCW